MIAEYIIYILTYFKDYCFTKLDSMYIKVNTQPYLVDLYATSRH